VAESTFHRCVFKLGGSLLDQFDWPSRLRDWLDQQPPGEFFGIVGGGDVIEAMRKLDRVHRLKQTAMHWRCIRLLDATLEIAAELMPDAKILDSPVKLQSQAKVDHQRSGSRGQRETYWVRVSAFYHPGSQELSGSSTDLYRPSEGWDTTTDTLAMMLAHHIQADRIVLMKSCDVGHVDSIENAVNLGILDRECLRYREHTPTVELLRL
jgi:5-(aminomethyl)-3-furanmethanol phosphate kinase